MKNPMCVCGHPLSKHDDIDHTCTADNYARFAFGIQTSPCICDQFEEAKR